MENSFGGVVFGIILAAGAVVMLFWNEGRAVKRYKDLNEGAAIVVSIAADKVDPANEAKLVHFSGKTATDSPVEDTVFGFSEMAIKLIRDAEMYQWVETISHRRTSGNGEEKEVTYKKEWRKDLVDSSHFVQGEGRRNPGQMAYRSRTFTAPEVKLGAFTLPDFLVAKINNREPYSITSLNRASPEVKKNGKIGGSGVYFGSDPAAPKIGDIRVTFSVVRPGMTSVIAKQTGTTLARYPTHTGGTIDQLEIGTYGADAMFQMEQHRNKVLTWGMRVVGFFMLGFGFSLLLGPLAAISSVIPLFGSIVGAGTRIIGFLLAAVVWTVTVALAWIYYRPLLGIGLLILTVGLLIVIAKKLFRGKQRQAATAGGSDSSPPPFSP